MKIKEYKIFICIALIFGFIFILIIPPFQSPDEDSHYKKAYVISNGSFYPSNINNQYSFQLSTNISDYINEQMSMAGNLDSKFSFKSMYFQEQLGNDFSNKVPQNFSTAASNPIAHIIPAFGMFIGKVIYTVFGMKSNITILSLLYWGRAFNLLFYILLFALAIKITPQYKKTFCLIGLFPMSLYLSSAISYDMIIIASAALFIAYWLKLYKNDNNIINWKNILALCAIGIPLISVKYLYILLFGLLLFIPKDKFPKNKWYFNKYSIISYIYLFLILSKFLLELPIKLVNCSSDGTLTAQQISFILSHPFKYISILLQTIIDGAYYYLSGMIGCFGLIDTNVPTTFILLFFICFCVFAIIEFSKSEIKFSIASRIFSAILVLGLITLIFTGLYLGWTAPIP